MAPARRPAVGAAAGLARRAWALPLPAHAAVLAVALMAAAPFLFLDDTFTADEGTYALQVRALERGSWAFDYRAGELDPAGEWLPLLNGTRGGDAWYAYVKHPAYPLVLRAATRAVGERAGLHLPALAGAVLVAVAAWLLAAQLDRRAARASFWLAGASPVAVNAYLVWAHAPAAAVAGLALVAALRFVVTGRAGWLVALLGLLSAGVLLRSESLLFAGAVAVALAVVGGPGRRLWVRAAVPAACLAVAGLTAVLEERWITSILGRGGAAGSAALAESVASAPDGGAGDWVSGRFRGAWNSLLRGAHLSAPDSVLVLAALVVLGLALVVGRRRRAGWERDTIAALALAAALYVVRAAGTDQAMTGLLAAWPVVLFAAAAPVVASRAARALGVVCAVFAAAVLLTQYPIGGGFEWGGRYLFPLLVPLSVLAVLGLREVVRQAGAAGPTIARLALVLAVVPVATGLVVLRTVRPLLGDVVDEVAATGRPLVLAHSPALPPAAWRTYPRVGWMRAPESDTVDVVARLRARGAEGLLVVAPRRTADRVRESIPGARDVSGPAARRLGWRLVALPG